MSAQAEAEAVELHKPAESGLTIDVEAAAAILDGIRNRAESADHGAPINTVTEARVQTILLLAMLDEQRRTREAFEALGSAVSEITSGGILNLLRKGGA